MNTAERRRKLKQLLTDCDLTGIRQLFTDCKEETPAHVLSIDFIHIAKILKSELDFIIQDFHGKSGEVQRNIERLNWFCYKLSGVRRVLLDMDTYPGEECGICWMALAKDVVRFVQEQITKQEQWTNELNYSTVLAAVHCIIWQVHYDIVYYWAPKDDKVGHLALAIDFEENEVSHWPADGKKISEVQALKKQFQEDVEDEGRPPDEAVLIPICLRQRFSNLQQMDWRLVEWLVPFVNCSATARLAVKLIRNSPLSKTLRFLNGFDFSPAVPYNETKVWSMQKNCATEVEKYLNLQGVSQTQTEGNIITPLQVKEKLAKLVLKHYSDTVGSGSDNYISTGLREYGDEMVEHIHYLLKYSVKDIRTVPGTSIPVQYSAVLKGMKRHRLGGAGSPV